MLKLSKEEKTELFLIIEEEVARHCGDGWDFEKLIANIDVRIPTNPIWYCDKCDFETQIELAAKYHSKENPGHTLWIKGEG